MERWIKKIISAAIALALMPFIYSDVYDAYFESLFINNKTNHEAMIHFFNEDYEQQQYPIMAKEHRFVKVKRGVMQRLFEIRVTIEDPKTGKIIVKSIDYEPNTGINRLKLTMQPELELKWGYEDDLRRDIDDQDAEDQEVPADNIGLLRR